MTCNFLLLNSDKTEVLLIGPKNYPKNLLPYNFRRMSCYFIHYSKRPGCQSNSTGMFLLIV